MKKAAAFIFIVIALVLNCSAYASIETLEYLTGRDLAPGTYTVEIRPENDNALTGVAVCSILRPSDSTSVLDTIQTDDMKLTNNHPMCTIELLDGDRLMIVYYSGYEVVLTNISGTEIADQYPGAIDGVNLTQAINETLAYIENNKFDFDGLKEVTIIYDSTLPSVNITMYYTIGEKDQYAVHLPFVLWKLNTACSAQNQRITAPTPKSNGGIYDDIDVVIGVYDGSIVYSDNAYDTYYILRRTTTITKYR